jgi:hypothetical protein
MAESCFVSYVGVADFHDCSILEIEQHDDAVRVRVRGANGKVFVVDFSGVREVRANRPEGMLLYALSELTGEPPLRRFAFVNWDDDDEAHLELDAEAIIVRDE